MSKKDVQDSKSVGRYLLESLDRIIKEVREERSKAAPKQGELSDVPRRRQRMFLPTWNLLTELNKDEEAPWKENKEGKKRTLVRIGSLRCSENTT